MTAGPPLSARAPSPSKSSTRRARRAGNPATTALRSKVDGRARRAAEPSRGGPNWRGPWTRRGAGVETCTRWRAPRGCGQPTQRLARGGRKSAGSCRPPVRAHPTLDDEHALFVVILRASDEAWRLPPSDASPPQAADASNSRVSGLLAVQAGSALPRGANARSGRGSLRLHLQVAGPLGEQPLLLKVPLEAPELLAQLQDARLLPL